MEKKISKFGFIAALLALAAPVFAAQITDDSLTLGKKGSAANKAIKMGQGQLIWSQTDSKLKFSNNGGTSVKDIGSGGGGGGGISILNDVNFDFEAGTANWTASSGSFTTVTTGSNLIFDGRSGVFNASASGQTLSNALVSIPEGFKSNNGAASCYFKTTAGDYKLQVTDGTNVLSERVIPAAPVATKIGLSFIFPSSGSVRLRIISQSDAADLAIDNCSLGENQLISVSQASVVGSAYIPITTGCQWSVTSVTPAPFATVSACPGPTVEESNIGTWLTTDSDLPRWTINSLPPGKYEVILTGINLGSGGQNANFTISDGTTLSGEGVGGVVGGGSYGSQITVHGIFTYTSAGNRTFELYGSSLTGSASAGVDTNKMRIVVKRFPMASEQAFRPDLVSFSAAAKINGGSSYVASTTGSNQVFSAAAFASKTFFGSASAPGSANDFAATISGIPAGDYLVYARAPMTAYATGSSSSDCDFQIYDGTTQLAQTSVEQISVTGLSNRSGISYISGRVSYSSFQASREFSLRGSLTASGGPGDCRLESASGAGGEIGIIPLTQTMPAPVLIGSVQSPAQGVSNVVTVRFGDGTGNACVASPCTIEAGSGFSGVTRLGAGDYVASFSPGMFTSSPVCTCSVSDASGKACTPQYAVGSINAVEVISFNSGSAVAADSDLTLICVGRK